MLDDFFKSFIPIFVALDVLGVLPLYAGFSMGLDEKKRRRVLRESIITAFLVTLGFILLGKQISTYPSRIFRLQGASSFSLLPSGTFWALGAAILPVRKTSSP